MNRIIRIVCPTRPRALLSLAAGCLLFVVVEPGNAQAPAPGRADGSVPASAVYTIKPNDIITVYVYLEPDLSHQVRVRPDGRISVPLVQDVRAAGRTPDELKAEIEVLLADWVQEPVVTILIDQFEQYRVFVQGQVAGQAGAIVSPEPLTVIQALAQAGNLAEYADEDNIRIFRTRGTQTQIFRFHYGDFVRGINLSQNIVLESGDTVVVP